MKAFPSGVTTNCDDVAFGQTGMDLRDWFAGLAMQSFIQASASSSVSELNEFKFCNAIENGIGAENTTDNMSYAYRIAEDAYFMADHMIDARKEDV